MSDLLTLLKKIFFELLLLVTRVIDVKLSHFFIRYFLSYLDKRISDVLCYMPYVHAVIDFRVVTCVKARFNFLNLLVKFSDAYNIKRM